MIQSTDNSRDRSETTIIAGPPTGRRWYGLTGFIVAAALVVTSFIVMLQRPLTWLLGIVPDDAFYYLGTARHLALAGHSTFDGINPTNGYHPAWMAVVTLLAWIVPDRVDLLYGVLVLCLLLHMVTAIVLVAVFTSLLGRFRGWLGGICWLLNPFPLLLALQGVETSLYLLALALVVWIYLVRIDPHFVSGSDSAPPARDLALFGSMIGLAFLARTDAIILAAVVTAYLTCRGVLRTRRGSRFAVAIRTLGPIAGSALLVVLPWLLYSYSVVGSPVQDSGVMKSLWASDNAALRSWSHDPAGVITFFRWHWLGDPLARMLALPMNWKALLSVGYILALGGTIYVLSRTARDVSFQRMLRLTLWLGTTMVATGIVYALFIGDIQIWHKGEPVLILFMLGFGWGALALQRLLVPVSGSVRLSVAGVVVAVAVVIFLAALRQLDPLYPWQSSIYEAQSRLHARAPDGAIIGSLNAGIPGYFGSRRVVNLDGLVNHTAVEYWRSHKFERLVHALRIDYILDTEHSMERARRFSSADLPLTPVDSMILVKEWPDFKYYLWEVDND